MRTPQLTVPRTSGQSTGRLNPVNVQGITPNAFGGGVAEGLQGLAAGIKIVEQRQEQTNRFDALGRLSKFQSDFSANMITFQREAPLGDPNLMQKTLNDFDKKSSEFLTTIPQELVDEFGLRFEQSRQAIHSNALQFQFESQDLKSKNDIAAQMNLTVANVASEPDSLEVWQQEMFEFIDQSTLPEIDKVEMKLDVEEQLSETAYKSSVENLVRQLPQNASTAIKDFEGLELKSYQDHKTSGGDDKFRVGYGNDIVVRANGTIEKVDKNTVISRADADRTLDYWLNTHTIPRVKKQVGGIYDTLSENVVTALLSVGFNYGHLPKSVVTAVKTGELDKIANSIEALSANKERRIQEAAIVRGYRSLDFDPRFDTVPQDRKIAIGIDTVRKINTLKAQETQAVSAREAAFTNNLLLGIYSGNKGKADIDAAIEAGDIKSFADVNRANSALAKYQSDTLLLSRYQQLAGTDSYVFSASSSDDKKGLNALVGATGQQALMEQNQEYMVNQFLPLVERAQVIPSEGLGILSSMTRSNDRQAAFYAYDALIELEEIAPDAYNMQINNDLAMKIEAYRLNRSYDTQEVLFDRLRGGDDTAARQNNSVILDEARTYLKNTANLSKVSIQSIVNEFDPLLFANRPATAGLPQITQGLKADFDTHFIAAYGLTRDPDKARDQAIEMLKRDWATTTIGGIEGFTGKGTILMKYPPELMGFPKLDGSLSWLEETVRDEIGLKEGETFQLISNVETEKDVNTLRNNPAGITKTLITDSPLIDDQKPAQLPSYGVLILGKDGPRILQLENGDPAQFVLSEGDIMDVNISNQGRINQEIEQARQLNIRNSILGAIFAQRTKGFPLTPEIIQAKKEFEAKFGPVEDAFEPENPLRVIPRLVFGDEEAKEDTRYLGLPLKERKKAREKKAKEDFIHIRRPRVVKEKRDSTKVVPRVVLDPSLFTGTERLLRSMNVGSNK